MSDDDMPPPATEDLPPPSSAPRHTRPHSPTRRPPKSPTKPKRHINKTPPSSSSSSQDGVPNGKSKKKSTTKHTQAQALKSTTSTPSSSAPTKRSIKPALPTTPSPDSLMRSLQPLPSEKGKSGKPDKPGKPARAGKRTNQPSKPAPKPPVEVPDEGSKEGEGKPAPAFEASAYARFQYATKNESLGGEGRDSNASDTQEGRKKKSNGSSSKKGGKKTRFKFNKKIDVVTEDPAPLSDEIPVTRMFSVSSLPPPPGLPPGPERYFAPPTTRPPPIEENALPGPPALAGPPQHDPEDEEEWEDDDPDYDHERGLEFLPATLNLGASTDKNAVLLSGWMMKKGGVRGEKKWQKRFWTLSCHELRYHTKEEDVGEVVKGVIKLGKAMVVEKSATQRRACFQIISFFAGDPERVCDSCFHSTVLANFTIKQVFEHENANRSSCPVCKKKFGILKGKFQCPNCFTTVCTDCSKNLMSMAQTRTFYLEPAMKERGTWIDAIRGHIVKPLTMAHVSKAGFMDWLDKPKKPIAGPRSPTGANAKEGFFSSMSEALAKRRDTKRRATSTQATLNRTWTMVYVTLRGSELYVYRRVKDHFPPEKPLAILDLQATQLLDFSHDPVRQDAFQLIPYDPDTTLEAEFHLCQAAGIDRMGYHMDLLDMGRLSAADIPKAFATWSDALATRDDWFNALCQAMPKKVFGVPLSLSCLHSGLNKLVPSPIELSAQWLGAHGGVRALGIYEQSGSADEVNLLIADFEGPGPTKISSKFNPVNLAQVVVKFLDQLPHSLFGAETELDFHDAAELKDSDALVAKFKELLSNLPSCNRCTLKCLVQHLVEVCYYADEHGMDAEKVSEAVYPRAALPLQRLIEHADGIWPPPPQ